MVICTKALRRLDFLYVAGRCGLRARRVRCGPGCGPPRAGIRLAGGVACGAGRSADQLTARWAASYDVAKLAVRADCGPRYCMAGRAAGCGPGDDQYAGGGGVGGLRAEL